MAVRTCVDDSRAARIPAPPAPTITTSYEWVCIEEILLGKSSGWFWSAVAEGREQIGRAARWARVEGEDDQGAEDDDERRRTVEDDLEAEPGTGPLRIVVDDRPDPVRSSTTMRSGPVPGSASR